MTIGLAPSAKGNPHQPLQVDISNSTPKVCACGGEYFIPAIRCYTVSAIVSPTGKELTAQLPVLVCMECKEALK